MEYEAVWVGSGHPLGPPPFHVGSGKSGKGSKGGLHYVWVEDESHSDGDDGWNGDDAPVVETDWEDDGHGSDDATWGDDGHEEEDDDYSPGIAWEDDAGVLDDDGNDDDYDGGEDEHYPNDVCFSHGKVVTCDGEAKGEAVHVEFSYSVETSGVDAEDTVSPLEDAILAAAVDYVSSLDSSYYEVARVSSSPKDYITGKRRSSIVDCLNTRVTHLSTLI